MGLIYTRTIPALGNPQGRVYSQFYLLRRLDPVSTVHKKKIRNTRHTCLIYVYPDFIMKSVRNEMPLFLGEK